MKHSSFKKTLSFLKYLQTHGLLTLTLSGHEDRLVAINRQHQYFLEHKEQIKVPDVEEFKAQMQLSTGDHSHTGKKDDHSGTTHSKDSKLKVLDLFKMPRPLKEVFLSVLRNLEINQSTEEGTTPTLSCLLGEGIYGECLTNAEVMKHCFKIFQLDCRCNG